MKRMEHRSGVGRSGCSENESCSIVLYFWEFRKKILKTTHLSVTLDFQSPSVAYGITAAF